MNFVKKFFEVWTDETRYHLPQIWCFLDAVLDESFIEELEVYVALQPENPDPRITSIITQHCPQLQSLTINFQSLPNITYHSMSPQNLRSFVSPLSSLRNLTSLFLQELKDDHKPLLSLIGTSCPRLRRLIINVLPFNNISKKRIVLAVLLGELIDKLIPKPNAEPIWSKDEGLEFLVIPPGCLTPICSTLDHFELQLSRSGPDIIGHSMSTLDAFAARHLPSIELAPGERVVGDPGRKTGHVAMQSYFERALCEAIVEIQRCNRRISRV